MDGATGLAVWASAAEQSDAAATAVVTKLLRTFHSIESTTRAL
ncbi:hypothetical protein BSU04_44495 [Caballeronia sordidicola]|uniref:Uncharacterized protein n=1 Tax=Caballeronia sordidicola TaxID=196367 RepID=A0A226WL01_CABSO|nr:hypothetical protein BSU04_44495 [Caballeronia sordidicola]